MSIPMEPIVQRLEALSEMIKEKEITLLDFSVMPSEKGKKLSFSIGYQSLPDSYLTSDAVEYYRDRLNAMRNDLTSGRMKVASAVSTAGVLYDGVEGDFLSRGDFLKLKPSGFYSHRFEFESAP